MATCMSLLLLIATLALLGAPAYAFDGEKELYEAAKKEKELTWYTAHYNTETAGGMWTAASSKCEKR